MTAPERAPEALDPCLTCGMWCRSGELHPYLACLAFKQCHDAETVRANLAFVVESCTLAERERIAAELLRRIDLRLDGLRALSALAPMDDLIDWAQSFRVDIEEACSIADRVEAPAPEGT